jgi:hypothetical protein
MPAGTLGALSRREWRSSILRCPLQGRGLLHNLARIGAVFLMAMGVAVSASSPASAEIVTFTATLSGAAQVPPAATPATGVIEARFDTVTHVFSWQVTYSGLIGAPTAAHFHGPSFIGENAGVAVPLQGALGSPIVGSAVLTLDQASDLMAGRWYLNIHTAAFPGGEIRTQLTGTGVGQR